MQPYPLSCPHCRNALAYDYRFSNQVVACPHCNGGFQMPSFQQPQSFTPYPPPPSQGSQFGFQTREEEPEPPRRRRRHNKGNGTVALVLGLIAIFLFPLLGPFAIMVAKGALRDDPDDGCAKAGLILGWICTAVLIFAFCIVGVYALGVMGIVMGRRR